MNELTTRVYQHLQTKASYNSLHNVIVLSTQRQTREALDLSLEQVQDAYQELLEYGVIEEYSEYQFIPALQFKMPDRLKRILGLR